MKPNTEHERQLMAHRRINLSWVKAYLECLTHKRGVRLLRPSLSTQTRYELTYGKANNEHA